MTAPEGASLNRIVLQEVSQLVDAFNRKKVALTITSPGFGSSSVK
jgi:hypothetical protein